MSGYRSDIQLGRFLGAGHFGRVYEAQDPVHGLVAVKKMERPPTFTCAEWDDERRRLLHEARMLQQARHPNVVRVFHLVEDADSILFAMEHCARGALQSVFETGPAGLNAVRQVAIEVGLGLCSLHAKNMLHRDIKPGNILVADDGTLKPDPELRRIFANAGVDLTQPLVTTCGSGVSAALINLALFKLGVHNAALYDGSWAEWGAQKDTPVAS